MCRRPQQHRSGCPPGHVRRNGGKWRSRFPERRLDGRSDEPRRGRPRGVTDDDVERVITLTLEITPRDATHWNTRSMAQRCGLTHNTVSRIWRAYGTALRRGCDRLPALHIEMQ